MADNDMDDEDEATLTGMLFFYCIVQSANVLEEYWYWSLGFIDNQYTKLASYILNSAITWNPNQ